MTLVIDIVPNHTSDQHEWFQAALTADRGSPERERYIFRDGTGPDGSEPPTDWQSEFGGDAWQRVEDGQWYLHFFAIEQPDLNWHHPEVREDFRRTLRFWSDRGVDGFRIDVAHMLTKDLTEPLPSQAELDALPIDGRHPTIDRDDVHEIYADWRTIFDSYDPPRSAIAEAWVASDRVPLYASSTSLGQSFNFDLVLADFDATQFREVIAHNLELATRSGSSSTWVLSNHDVVRHATRYGLPPATERKPNGHPVVRHGEEWLRSGGHHPELDRERGLRRARAATLLMFGLPGSSYLYQGEELGLHEVAEIAPEQRQCPRFLRTDGADIGRDGCRVPLPWKADEPDFGFGGPAHLPQPEWFGRCAVDLQDADPDSTLALYRRAIRLRRELQDSEGLEWIESAPDLIHFRRAGGWEVLTNFGPEPIPLLEGTVLLASGRFAGDRLPGETTVWLKQ